MTVLPGVPNKRLLPAVHPGRAAHGPAPRGRAAEVRRAKPRNY